jgi:hypothetical protein
MSTLGPVVKRPVRFSYAAFPDSGINIWPQKTLQSHPSAIDRVNVRRLMMYIAESSRFAVN